MMAGERIRRCGLFVDGKFIWSQPRVSIKKNPPTSGNNPNLLIYASSHRANNLSEQAIFFFSHNTKYIRPL